MQINPQIFRKKPQLSTMKKRGTVISEVARQNKHARAGEEEGNIMEKEKSF